MASSHGIATTAADIRFMSYTLLVAKHKSPVTFSTRPHSRDKLTVPANVAVCLCASFVATPTGLISVNFDMETLIYDGNFYGHQSRKC